MAVFVLQTKLAQRALTQQEYRNAIFALEIAFEKDFFPTTWSEDLHEVFTDALQILTTIARLPLFVPTNWLQETLAEIQSHIQTKDTVKIDIAFRTLIQAFVSVSDLLEKQNMTFADAQELPLKIDLSKNEGKIHVQIIAKVNQTQGGISTNQAQNLQAQFLQTLSHNNTPAQQLSNLASQLLTQGLYEQSIEIYEKLLEQFPEKEAEVHNGIGANYYFLRQYEKAIAHYLQAYEVGLDAQMADYNVWEACAELVKISSHPEEKKKWKNIYKKHFPEGKQIFNDD